MTTPTSETPPTTGGIAGGRVEQPSRPTAPSKIGTVRERLPKELVARLVEQVVTGSEPAKQATVAPFNGETIAELPQSTPGDVRLAFDQARNAQRAWAVLPVKQRAAVILALHDLILENRDQLLDLIQIETGKARKHAIEEVLGAAIVARHYGYAGRRYLRPHRRGGAFPVFTRVHEIRAPKGVVGVITPWNYPLALASSDIFPALIAGNGVVHKPDTQTALVGLRLRELAIRAGVPPEIWQTVIGEGPIVGSAVVDNADYVSFTGSTRVGRQVAQQAALRLIGCSLELGGKNPMLVLDDADIDDAVSGAVRGSFASSGQLCISIERIYVHYAVYDEFVQRFLTEVKAMRLGTGLDFTADMGSLTSTRQLEAVTLHVEDARAKGAQVLAGGRRRPDIGPLFYEPTVLGKVSAPMHVFSEETFGPVVSLYEFRNEADAIASANATVYGLNASVWTRDAKRGREIAAKLHTGGVNVNEAYSATYGSVAAPMGGVGDSGLGRRHGSEGILRYTEGRTIARQWLIPIAPVFGMSEATWSKWLYRTLGLLKRLHVR